MSKTTAKSKPATKPTTTSKRPPTTSPAALSTATAAVLAPAAPTVALQCVAPFLDERFKTWLGPDSAYGHAKARIDLLKSQLKTQESITEFELGKLRDFIFPRLNDPQLAKQMGVQWYDNDLAALIRTYFPETNIAEWYSKGIDPGQLGDRISERLEEIAVVDSKRLRGDDSEESELFDGCMVLNGVVIGAIDGDLILTTSDDWSEFGANGDASYATLGNGYEVADHVMRAMGLLDMIDAAKARSSAAEKGKVKATKPARAKVSPRSKADKGKEVAALASKPAKAAGKPAAKPKAQKAAKSGVVKATLLDGKPDGFLLKYRTADGHTRTKSTVTGMPKAVWLASVCKELGIDPAKVVDQSTRGSVAPLNVAPAVAALPDGFYLYNNGDPVEGGGSWMFRKVERGKDVDKGRVMQGDSPIKHAFLSASRVLGMPLAELFLIGTDGQVAPGTGEDFVIEASTPVETPSTPTAAASEPSWDDTEIETLGEISGAIISKQNAADIYLAKGDWELTWRDDRGEKTAFVSLGTDDDSTAKERAAKRLGVPIEQMDSMPF